MLGIIIFNSFMKTSDVEGYREGLAERKKKQNKKPNRKRREGFTWEDLSIDKLVNNFSIEPTPPPTINDTTDNSKSKNTQLILVYADWCGHCKKMKPDWDKFESKYKDMCQSYESSTDEAKRLFKQYDLKGYPALLFIKDGKKVDDYTGPRTYAGFEKAIQQYM